MLTKSALSAAAATAATALLYRREQHAKQITERLAAAALETLLNAIDANDGDTGTHVRRVAAYALILAEAAGLSEHEQKPIERVALFHDIGKIHGALFDIIHDGKTLTAAERREISTHPARGARVLAPLTAFYPELPEGVLAHHERWDGKGYPRHLKGRRIPLNARIVSIADTFDAITHSRPYRQGQSIAVAYDAMLHGRGTQFDPELVDLFTFPPVFEQVVAALEKMKSWPVPARQRDSGRDEQDVPDINFRWRPSRRAGAERGAPNQVRRVAR
jgi:HD-GYP domain-containing protein (c-di-GMP phosphodiesterase class II)